MPLHDATIALGLGSEVIVAAQTLVKGANCITAQAIKSADHVYAFSHPDTKPERYIVLREQEFIGGNYSSISNRRIIYMQAEVVCDRETPNPQLFCEAVHADVYAALVGQKPSLTNGSVELGFSIELHATPAQLDGENNEWFSTAVYICVLAPL